MLLSVWDNLCNSDALRIQKRCSLTLAELSMITVTACIYTVSPDSRPLPCIGAYTTNLPLLYTAMCCCANRYSTK